MEAGDKRRERERKRTRININFIASIYWIWAADVPFVKQQLRKEHFEKERFTNVLT